MLVIDGMADNSPRHVPDYEARTSRSRFSRLAGVAIVLAILPAIADIVIAVAIIPAVNFPKEGWDGFGQAMFVFVATVITIYGGTSCAILAIILGLLSLRRIRRSTHIMRGVRTARAAVVIAIASLISLAVIVLLIF